MIITEEILDEVTSIIKKTKLLANPLFNAGDAAEWMIINKKLEEIANKLERINENDRS